MSDDRELVGLDVEVYPQGYDEPEEHEHVWRSTPSRALERCACGTIRHLAFVRRDGSSGSHTHTKVQTWPA